MAEDKLKTFSDKLSTIQKMLITAGAIALSLYGAVEWVSMRVAEHDEKVINQNADLFAAKVLEVISESGVATQADIYEAQDSITFAMDLYADANEAMHLRTLRRQDTIILALEERIRLEADLNIRLDTIEDYIRTINGTTKLSMREQQALAREDSLRTILIFERQKANNNARMRQLEQQHRQALDEIRDLSESEVIDKGRPKRVRNRNKKFESRDWDFGG